MNCRRGTRTSARTAQSGAIMLEGEGGGGAGAAGFDDAQEPLLLQHPCRVRDASCACAARPASSLTCRSHALLPPNARTTAESEPPQPAASQRARREPKRGEQTQPEGATSVSRVVHGSPFDPCELGTRSLKKMALCTLCFWRTWQCTTFDMVRRIRWILNHCMP